MASVLSSQPQKLQRKQPLILNKLDYINKLCESTSIKFLFVFGEDNPADCIIRPLFYRQLMKTCYISGPASVTNNIPNGMFKCETISFTLPGPPVGENSNTVKVYGNSAFFPPDVYLNHLVLLDGCSSFHWVAMISDYF